jgi:hypothetical protein
VLATTANFHPEKIHVGNQLIWQIGAGGLLALLVLREVFGFLREKNRATAAGDKSVDFWRMEMRSAFAECFAATLKPFLEAQNQLLREIRDSVTTSNLGISELVVKNRDNRRIR